MQTKVGAKHTQEEAACSSTELTSPNNCPSRARATGRPGGVGRNLHFKNRGECCFKVPASNPDISAGILSSSKCHLMKSDITPPSYDSEEHGFKIDFPSMMFPATSFQTKHRNMHQLFTVASSLALSGARLALCVMLREISAAREETDTLTVSLTP